MWEQESALFLDNPALLPLAPLTQTTGSPGVVVISLYYELLKEFYGKLFRLQTQ